MSQFGTSVALFMLLSLSGPIKVEAIETAQLLSGREIIERLIRVTTKIEANTAAIAQFQADGQPRGQQGRAFWSEETSARFDWKYRLIWWILGALVALAIGAAIGFALWDRRTMLRLLEDRIKAVEDKQARDHERLDSLLEVFRSLGRGDERVAEMLRQSRLL